MSYPVSVIVPVYKVEKYIERCARSLLEQTFPGIEYIFANDCTPDQSMQVLERVALEYPHRLKDIRYVSHPRNEGLPTARNSGMSLATGDYIFHCDSDDWVDKDMIEKMYLATRENNADIVYTDWYLSYRRNERYMPQPELKTPAGCLKAILDGSMKYNVWNKLIKRKVYIDNQVFFPDGLSMGEDMTIIRLFCHAEKVVYLGKAFYHYMQTNTNAYTKVLSDLHLSQIHRNADLVVTNLYKLYGTKSLEKEIHFFRLNVKLPLLISSQKKMYETWLQWFPESNRYIKQNTSFPFRIRCIQYAAIKGHYWLIRLHYYGIVRFVYGIIYR